MIKRKIENYQRELIELLQNDSRYARDLAHEYHDQRMQSVENVLERQYAILRADVLQGLFNSIHSEQQRQASEAGSHRSGVQGGHVDAERAGSSSHSVIPDFNGMDDGFRHSTYDQRSVTAILVASPELPDAQEETVVFTYSNGERGATFISVEGRLLNIMENEVSSGAERGLVTASGLPRPETPVAVPPRAEDYERETQDMIVTENAAHDHSLINWGFHHNRCQREPIMLVVYLFTDAERIESLEFELVESSASRETFEMTDIQVLY